MDWGSNPLQVTKAMGRFVYVCCLCISNSLKHTLYYVNFIHPPFFKYLFKKFLLMTVTSLMVLVHAINNLQTKTQLVKKLQKSWHLNQGSIHNWVHGIQGSFSEKKINLHFDICGGDHFSEVSLMWNKINI